MRLKQFFSISGNENFCPVSEFRSESFDEFRLWTIASRDPVTHDVDHYVLEPPKDMVSQGGTGSGDPRGQHNSASVEFLGSGRAASGLILGFPTFLVKRSLIMLIKTF